MAVKASGLWWGLFIMGMSGGLVTAKAAASLPADGAIPLTAFAEGRALPGSGLVPGMPAAGTDGAVRLSPATARGAAATDAQPAGHQPAVAPGRKAASRPMVAVSGPAAPARVASSARPVPVQTAMLSWPMTDSGVPAPISVEAMSSLASRVLEQAGIGRDSFGLVVQPLGKGGLQVDHLGGQPFNPASTMKLVTTHAALSMLGPQYRWTTRFYLTGPIRDGVLHGDLVMQGGGDPHLVIEDLHALMADMRARGLRTIRGNLVIDDSRFAVRNGEGRAFDGDGSQAYNVLPYAALMNFKASRLVIDPKQRRLTLEPPLADVRLRYDVKVLKGRCRPGATRLAVRESVGRDGQPVVAVTGTQVRACGTQQFYAAMLDHQRFVHGIFKAAWRDMGGVFEGRTLIEPGAAARGKLFHEWVSSTDLAGAVHHINKYSNNVMTRMLLLEMAVAQDQGALRPEAAGHWLRDWYRRQGLPMASLLMENGSGLSRVSRISAQDLVAVLVHAAGSATAAEFEASLPVVGIDGTMRTRLRHEPLAGQAQIKTGTLNDVRAIAGYVTAASGERYALALMINGPYVAGRALAAQDELLRWVYRHG